MKNGFKIQCEWCYIWLKENWEIKIGQQIYREKIKLSEFLLTNVRMIFDGLIFTVNLKKVWTLENIFVV